MGHDKEIRVAIAKKDADASLIMRLHYSKTVNSSFLALGVFIRGPAGRRDGIWPVDG
ncbi:hypothetical protein J6524_09140 [Bradyrhizobium sp. WSM 1738]|uniref:hypothetical protein n=1 Tax=Bradyrhizobium hereditatis TaxID=2821405 RepID=UPI001CE2748F|nr:hypothetical protein [Bradyrhizobium hereditatis]MCA6115071.1 hypothetical protein [Bradyrhizobium hereditatis]